MFLPMPCLCFPMRSAPVRPRGIWIASIFSLFLSCLLPLNRLDRPRQANFPRGPNFVSGNTETSSRGKSLLDPARVIGAPRTSGGANRSHVPALKPLLGVPPAQRQSVLYPICFGSIKLIGQSDANMHNLGDIGGY